MYQLSWTAAAAHVEEASEAEASAAFLGAVLVGVAPRLFLLADWASVGRPMHPRLTWSNRVPRALRPTAEVSVSGPARHLRRCPACCFPRVLRQRVVAQVDPHPVVCHVLEVDHSGRTVKARVRHGRGEVVHVQRSEVAQRIGRVDQDGVAQHVIDRDRPVTSSIALSSLTEAWNAAEIVGHGSGRHGAHQHDCPLIPSPQQAQAIADAVGADFDGRLCPVGETGDKGRILPQRNGDESASCRLATLISCGFGAIPRVRRSQSTPIPSPSPPRGS